MTQAWTWPDVVAEVTAVLAAGIDAPVLTRVPDPRPESFIRVQRVGGAREQVLDRARVVVECWALDEAAAWDLAALARDLLRRARTAPLLHVAETGGPALVADPLTGTPRYWLTVEVTARPSPAA